MIVSTYYTDIGGRLENEDSVGEKRGKNALCILTADGLGGHGGGASASQEARRVILDGWNESCDASHLKDLVLEAHEAICRMQTQTCAMKSTVAVLAIAQGKAAWAHVGDTRLYHFLDGALIFQTRDHSASQIAVMLGDITPDQIRSHPDRGRITRALGQENALTVETKTIDLERGRHAFLLCTDGFWEYVLEEEMILDLRSAKDPQSWLDAMRNRLKARIPSDNDNNTAAVVWLDEK